MELTAELGYATRPMAGAQGMGTGPCYLTRFRCPLGFAVTKNFGSTGAGVVITRGMCCIHCDFMV